MIHIFLLEMNKANKLIKKYNFIFIEIISINYNDINFYNILKNAKLLFIINLIRYIFVYNIFVLYILIL